MTCPYGTATTTSAMTKRTPRGYRIVRCSAYRRQFDERTVIPCSYWECPTDIVPDGRYAWAR